MHPYKRSKRVKDLLREEIALIVMRRLKDPRIGFLTVTSVEITEDLKLAKAYISVLKPEDIKTTLEVLNAAAGFIRSELAKTVRMKFIPEIAFFQDSSISYGQRIDDLLKQIRGGQ